MNNEMQIEKLLGKLTELRASIPHLSPAAPVESPLTAGTIEEFEAATLMSAVESLLADVRTTIAETERRAYEDALDVYYATEELARDPNHPETIPHLEAMRAAHQEAYGKRVPTKEETERRRAGTV